MDLYLHLSSAELAHLPVKGRPASGGPPRTERALEAGAPSGLRQVLETIAATGSWPDVVAELRVTHAVASLLLRRSWAVHANIAAAGHHARARDCIRRLWPILSMGPGHRMCRNCAAEVGDEA